jgi:hypothetical protein
MTSGHHLVWTIEHADALVGFIGAGLSFWRSAEEINKRFGTHYSRNAVASRCHRTGIRAIEKPRLPTKKRHQPYKPRPKVQFKPTATAEAIQLRCEALAPLHIQLIDLTDTSCRFPFGESAPYTFCGLKVVDETSYCLDHLALCSGGK